jgi:aminomethyltransferase
MVEFAGWDMPLHYGSQIEEHHAVRRAAGVFDVSHMQALDLHGPGARSFLQRALANSIDKLRAPGTALYSCLLNEQGGVVDDLIAFFVADGHYRLIVNAGTADKDAAWLETIRKASGFQVELRRRPDLALLAVQGPAAREQVWQALPGSRAATEGLRPFAFGWVGDALVSRTGYTGEDGFEIALPAAGAEALWSALVQAGVRPCGLGARDTLRMEAGFNLYGQDMDDGVSPLDAGLAWTVDLRGERDFVGRAALVRNGQHWQLLGLLLQETGGVLRSHQAVATAQGAGMVTSGTFSPTLNGSIALARLPLDVPAGARVHVTIRAKALAAKVVKPPFVRHGKVLVS